MPTGGNFQRKDFKKKKDRKHAFDQAKKVRFKKKRKHDLDQEN